MKIKEGYILSEIAGSYHVVAVGKAVKEFKGIINLNKSGAFLFERLTKGATEDELVMALVSEYEVDEQTARNDVIKFTKGLAEANLVE